MPASVLTAHVSLVKMDDRKRSGEELVPPSKRQAVNGKSTSADADMPWSADLEVSLLSSYGITSFSSCRYSTSTPLHHHHIWVATMAEENTCLVYSCVLRPDVAAHLHFFFETVPPHPGLFPICAFVVSHITKHLRLLKAGKLIMGT